MGYRSFFLDLHFLLRLLLLFRVFFILLRVFSILPRVLFFLPRVLFSYTTSFLLFIIFFIIFKFITEGNVLSTSSYLHNLIRACRCLK